MVRDNVMEVFPFVMGIDRYTLAASGLQHLDESFSYHLSAIKSPLLVKFGINIWGDIAWRRTTRRPSLNKSHGM